MEQASKNLFFKKRDQFPSSLEKFEQALYLIAERESYETTSILQGSNDEGSLALNAWIEQKEKQLFNLINRPQTNVERHLLRQLIIEDLISDFPKETIPLLIPFADTNHCNVGSIHAYMWYDPVHKRYDVVEAHLSTRNHITFSHHAPIGYDNFVVWLPDSSSWMAIQQRRSTERQWS